MNIYLFDFDNTIVELPYKESIHYMDTDESLDPSLGFKLIKRTRKDYQDALQSNDGPIFLLSNRVTKVREALEKTLKLLGYKFDDYYLIDGEDRNKGNRLKQILKKYMFGMKQYPFAMKENFDKDIGKLISLIKV